MQNKETINNDPVISSHASTGGSEKGEMAGMGRGVAPVT